MVKVMRMSLSASSRASALYLKGQQGASVVVQATYLDRNSM